MPEIEKSNVVAGRRVALGGGVGAAIGVLVVIFMPPSWHVFTVETGAIAAAAIGSIASFIVSFLPARG